MKKYNILYVYEERIPFSLRKLVKSYISRKKFNLKEMTYNFSEKKQQKLIAWSDAVLLAPGRHLSNKVLHAGKGKVKLMQLWSSGYDKFNVTGANKANIPVANNGGANAISVAEHAILLMQAVNKKLPEYHERTITGRWKGNAHGMDLFNLYGKTLGIIGFGNVGKNVASRCRGFGMKIIYNDIKRATKNIEKRYDVKFEKKNNLLKKADILSLHLHLNKKTKNIINKKSLKLMKRNSIIINVSRSQLIDCQALTKALKRKKIRGAGLDVFDKEPTKPNDPLLKHPNVVATPHISGSTYDVYKIVISRCLDNIKLALRNKKPMWLINNYV